MKQDRNFRMPKEVKRLLASMPNQKSSVLKSLMIQGIILGSVETPREKKKNRNNVTQTESE
jgi:hypothetical protein